jgi:hypothetical protein
MHIGYFCCPRDSRHQAFCHRARVTASVIPIAANMQNLTAKNIPLGPWGLSVARINSPGTIDVIARRRKNPVPIHASALMKMNKIRFFQNAPESPTKRQAGIAKRGQI